MKCVVFAAAFLTIGLFAPQRASAQPIVACVHKSTGAVRIVSDAAQCKNTETPATWNLTGPAGATGPQGPTGPAGPGLLRLFDFNNQLIGTTLNANQVLMRPAPGQLFAATITDAMAFPAGFNQTSTGLIAYFKDPDCAGDPYFRVSGMWGGSVAVNGFATPILNYPGYTMLYAQLPAENITAASQYQFIVFPPFGYACQNISLSMKAGKIATLPLEPFAAPFHLDE